MWMKQNCFAKNLLIFQNILEGRRMDTVLKKRSDSSRGGKVWKRKQIVVE
jgi:hypothetical protein